MADDERILGYATAIFEVARAEGRLEDVEDELFRIARTVEGNPPLRDALTDPRLPVERKQAVLGDLLEGKASPLTRALVSFVVALGRANHLSEIADQMVELASAERNRVVAEVRSAIPLDAATIQKLEEGLSKATGKQVDVKLVVDPSLIGGIAAQVGDVVIDGSVRHRLDELRERFDSAKEGER
ncbi:MAG: ATP synthase F1 subunit delta [Actinomycetota bacterium]|nr:ATP synthase F1 subunit delta [Actinomycetota bacterium]